MGWLPRNKPLQLNSKLSFLQIERLELHQRFQTAAIHKRKTEQANPKQTQRGRLRRGQSGGDAVVRYTHSGINQARNGTQIRSRELEGQNSTSLAVKCEGLEN